MVAVYDGFVNESIGNLVPCCGYRPVRILSTKIVKLLRLMKILTGNVSMTIDQIAKEMHINPRTIYRYIDNIREVGFVVNKLYGNVYAMGKVGRGLSDFNKLIYFTEEEAYITSKFIEGIDNNNVLKRNLQRKLASVYNITCIGDYVGNAACAENVEGAGRFVIGLAADVKILEGAKLLAYIKNYDKKYVQKLG